MDGAQFEHDEIENDRHRGMARQDCGTVSITAVTACCLLTSSGSISYTMPRSLIYPQYESVPTYRDCHHASLPDFWFRCHCVAYVFPRHDCRGSRSSQFRQRIPRPRYLGRVDGLHLLHCDDHVIAPCGKSERQFRKEIHLFGFPGSFYGSSLACGLSPNIYALIGFRFVQGIGGAAFLPVASGIVSERFPENRERMIGLFTSIVPVGGLIGPNLGGWIVSSFSWRYIFYINLPIGVLLIGMVLWLIRDSKLPPVRRSTLPGIFSMSGGILFLMFALNVVGESFATRSLFLAGLLLLLSSASLCFSSVTKSTTSIPSCTSTCSAAGLFWRRTSSISS